MRGHFLRAAAGNGGGAYSQATLDYLAAVEAADGQALEAAVYTVMADFAEWRIPLGGQCALFSGARTLAGALVAMVGPNLTNINFIEGDYNRKKLTGDGATKALTTGINAASQNLDSNHVFTFNRAATGVDNGTVLVGALGLADNGVVQHGLRFTRYYETLAYTYPTSFQNLEGFAGITRTVPGSFSWNNPAGTGTQGREAQSGNPAELLVFARGTPGSPTTLTTQPVSIYSFGPGLDLSVAKTYCDSYITAIDSAIP